MDIERAAKIIRKMKGIPGGHGLRFPIRDEHLNVIGYLRGFDAPHLRDDALIETMALAHTHYKEFFLTQFDVTPENKRSWLENLVLGGDKKMLFLVETLAGAVVGQDGFTIRDGGMFSLDATIKWARDGCPALFLRSGFERAAICFILLGCVRGESAIFGKNVAAMLNIKRMGFHKTGEYPLTKSSVNERVTYAKANDMSSVNTGEALVEYAIEREEFIANNPNLIANPCWGDFFP